MRLLPNGTHVLVDGRIARVEDYRDDRYQLYWYYCDTVGSHCWTYRELKPISDEQAALLLLGSDG